MTAETLETLLSGEGGATNNEPTSFSSNTNTWEETFIRPQSVPVTMARSLPPNDTSPNSDNTAVGDALQPRIHPHAYNRVDSYAQPDSYIDDLDKDEDINSSMQRVPVHDQRTILVSNLSDRTTHKDLVSFVRGGRLLDIFLRNDRTATVSFVEGAAEFLAYTKRNDIYLHTKRVRLTVSEHQSREYTGRIVLLGT